MGEQYACQRSDSTALAQEGVCTQRLEIDASGNHFSAFWALGRLEAAYCSARMSPSCASETSTCSARNCPQALRMCNSKLKRPTCLSVRVSCSDALDASAQQTLLHLRSSAGSLRFACLQPAHSATYVLSFSGNRNAPAPCQRRHSQEISPMRHCWCWCYFSRCSWRCVQWAPKRRMSH